MTKHLAVHLSNALWAIELLIKQFLRNCYFFDVKRTLIGFLYTDILDGWKSGYS